MFIARFIKDQVAAGTGTYEELLAEAEEGLLKVAKSPNARLIQPEMWKPPINWKKPRRSSGARSAVRRQGT
jgi:hypothetical protein